MRRKSARLLAAIPGNIFCPMASHSPDRLRREEARRTFEDEATEAWRDFVQTGHHVTQAALDSWIDSLDTRRPK